MKRFLPWAAFVAGLVLIAVLLPLFNAAQPAGIRLTRGDARAIADAAAQKIGIPTDRPWSVLDWEAAARCRKELDPALELRRKAASDPVVGPRLGAYHVIYYRRGLEKYPEHGYV